MKETGMTRLKFDGKVTEYHPATGLMFEPGESDYPDEHVAALIATGRFHKTKATAPEPPKGGKAKE